MIKEVKDFKRQELFKHYNESDNPFVYLTTKIDITNVVNYCKIHKNFYATFGYLVTQAVNKVDAFKYRHINKKIYFCDKLKSNYTQKINNQAIAFFDIPDIVDYNEYIFEYKKRNEKVINNQCDYLTEGEDCVWLSCLPWMTFTGLITPYRKSITIPQFVWDKYQQEGDKYTIHLMIMVHHGFADGYNIYTFVQELENCIKSFPQK